MTNLIKMPSARPLEAKRLEFRVHGPDSCGHYSFSISVDNKCVPLKWNGHWHGKYPSTLDCVEWLSLQDLRVIALCVLNLGHKIYTSGCDTCTNLIAEGAEDVVLWTHVRFSKRWCDGQFAPSHIEIYTPVPDQRWLVPYAAFADALTAFYETLKLVVGADKLPEIFDPNINWRHMRALPGYHKENV